MTLVVCAAAATLMALGERVLLILCSNPLILEFLQLRLAVRVGRRRGHTDAHHRSCLHPVVPILSILVKRPIVSDWLGPAQRGRAC